MEEVLAVLALSACVHQRGDPTEHQQKSPVPSFSVQKAEDFITLGDEVLNFIGSINIQVAWEASPYRNAQGVVDDDYHIIGGVAFQEEMAIAADTGIIEVRADTVNSGEDENQSRSIKGCKVYVFHYPFTERGGHPFKPTWHGSSSPRPYSSREWPLSDGDFFTEVSPDSSFVAYLGSGRFAGYSWMSTHQHDQEDGLLEFYADGDIRFNRNAIHLAPESVTQLKGLIREFCGVYGGLGLGLKHSSAELTPIEPE